VRNERLVLSVVTLALLSAPLSASAQAPARVGRVLSLLAGDAVGVLVSRDRVFVADAGVQALSVCAGSRCAPVASVESCVVPRCPGSGMLLSLAAPIADVSDLPTDRDGFNRAMNELRAEPGLAPIAWSFGVHPDPQPSPPQPPRWITPQRLANVAWEIGAYGLGGVLGNTGVAFTGGEVSGGFRFTWDPRGDDDEFLAILLGDTLGADIRVRTLALLPVQGGSTWSVTLGLAPAMGYVTHDEVFRLPTFYSCLLPEVGVALREGYDAAWYAGWSLPITFLLAEHIGIEARASVMLVDDWIKGDDVEAIVSFGLGLVAI
jgi:hypothetical protein